VDNRASTWQAIPNSNIGSSGIWVQDSNALCLYTLAGRPHPATLAFGGVPRLATIATIRRWVPVWIARGINGFLGVGWSLRGRIGRPGSAAEKKLPQPLARESGGTNRGGGSQWCGTFSPKDRTRHDRGDRATCGGHHSASGPLRLLTVRPPVVSAGGTRRAGAVQSVQVQAMERCRGARVRAIRAVVSEASPILRRNQSRTDHARISANRTRERHPCGCPLTQMRAAVRRRLRDRNARMWAMIPAPVPAFPVAL